MNLGFLNWPKEITVLVFSANEVPSLMMQTLLLQLAWMRDRLTAVLLSEAVTLRVPLATAISDWLKSIWKKEEA